MRWALQWSSYEHVLQERADQGLEVKALQDKPILADHLQLVWNAFVDLDASRDCGMVPQAVKISEIVSWLDLHDIRDLQLRLDIVDLIRKMDAVRLVETQPA